MPIYPSFVHEKDAKENALYSKSANSKLVDQIKPPKLGHFKDKDVRVIVEEEKLAVTNDFLHESKK